MKRPTHSTVAIGIVIALLVLGSPRSSAATAAQKTTKLPAKLPAKKKKTKVNFDNPTTHTTTVVVRTPLPLEKALEDQAESLSAIAEGTPTSSSTIPAPVQTATSRQSIFVSPSPGSASPSAPAPVKTPAPRVQPSHVVASPFLMPAPAPTPIAAPPPVSAEARVATTLEKETEQAVRTSIYLRSSYIDAHYSDLQGDLQNGATSMALGVSRSFAWDFEWRALIEIGHGLDQEVALKNTRYSIVRIDLANHFARGPLRPFAAFGLGYADFDVRSYRATASNDVAIRSHAKGGALFAAPALGVRLELETLALDLAVEYSAFLGSAHSLGGVTGSLGLAVPF